jgi:hypothetical protein
MLELQHHTPVHGFWLPVLHAAVLAKLGRLDEAKVHIKNVEEQKPDFATRAHELFRRTVKVEALIEDLIDGLKMAGLSIGS